jgi:hypothetical protein
MLASGHGSGDNVSSISWTPAMSMKKTDLEKHLAKKLDGRMKSTAVPQRFGQGSAATKGKTEQKSQPSVTKLVAVSCRLPADLVNRLRDLAAAHDGGMNALLAQAAEHWLATAGAQKPE